MANSSLGLTIGISTELATKLRQGSLVAPPEETAVEVVAKESLDHDALPGISIHLEKLIGYQPADSNEVESIQHQLVAAMWTRYQQTTSDGQLTVSSDTDQPPPDFDRHVMEFFETGVARYEESPKHQEGHLILRYPTQLQSPVTGERILTQTLVKQIQQQEQQPHEFIAKLWLYLRQCSRPLFWKRDMAQELTLLVREEQARLDYEEWTASTRQAKLDNLYSIRETLVHQVELAKSKVERLEEQRDIQVDEEMEPFRRKVHQHASPDAFGSSELSFPEEFQWLGLTDQPVLDDEDDWGLTEESNDEHESCNSTRSDELADESSANDDDEIDLVVVTELDVLDGHQSEPKSLSKETEPVPAPTTTVHNMAEQEFAEGDGATKPSLSLPFQQRKNRREKSKQRKRQQQKAAEQKARQLQLQRMEEGLRSKLTSNELILAQTMHNALSQKMEKIEELLDSLQDEVWQAEEEREQPADSAKATDNTDKQTLSLLDQVLAMILGATPIPDGKAPAEHFHFMQSEHKSIVQAWKAHFGRLPPPAMASSDQVAQDLSEQPLSSKDHREELGIVDNDGDNWEEVEDWDTLLDGKKKEPTSKQVANTILNAKTNPKRDLPGPKLVGLRPGGRVVRRSQD